MSALEEQPDVEVTAQLSAGRKASSQALGWRNWATLIAYIVNSVVTYVSLTGIFGETNTELSDKYQTLITPAGWAFSIWGLIFIGEAISVIAQMLSRYRGKDVVLVSAPWWLAACAFQVVWTLVFAQDIIWASLICMLGILASLIGMALSVDRIALTAEEYFLFRAPFALHLGWIVAASMVNINVLADASSAKPDTLLGIAMLSLAAVLLIVALFALLVRRPEPIVGLVAVWALSAIASALQDPELLNNPDRFNPYMWDPVVTSAVRFAAIGLAIVCGALVVLAVVLRVTGNMTARLSTMQQAMQ